MKDTQRKGGDVTKVNKLGVNEVKFKQREGVNEVKDKHKQGNDVTKKFPSNVEFIENEEKSIPWREYGMQHTV